MTDLENLDEMGGSSIHRLEKLLQMLEISGAVPKNFPISTEENFAEQWHAMRQFQHAAPFHVGPEQWKMARELVALIEKQLHRISQKHLNRRKKGVDNGGWSNLEWTFGSVVYVLGRREILRGTIELLRTVPIFPDIPDAVVQFLVTVPGTRDQITRETHGHWGYHYHYLDDKNRRSDTLLTFDPLSTHVEKPTLRWERHAEKHGFKAKAGCWGLGKRQSIYTVCLPDALDKGLINFKRPSSTSDVVWPIPITAPLDSLAVKSALRIPSINARIQTASLRKKRH